LCQTLSLNRASSFSSFVDKALSSGGLLFLWLCCLYSVENFGARLLVWFWIRTVSVIWLVWRKC
jgi:hypothetical protein